MRHALRVSRRNARQFFSRWTRAQSAIGRMKSANVSFSGAPAIDRLNERNGDTSLETIPCRFDCEPFAARSRNLAAEEILDAFPTRDSQEDQCFRMLRSDDRGDGSIDTRVPLRSTKGFYRTQTWRMRRPRESSKRFSITTQCALQNALECTRLC